MIQPTVEQWQAYLADSLADVLPDVGDLGPLPMQKLPTGKTHAVDGTLQILVRDSRGDPTAVALCSAPASPGLVARGMRNAAAAKAALPAELNAVILDPLFEGKLNDLSCAVLPHCRPLSTRRIFRRVQRRFLQSPLLGWLRKITKLTVSAPDRSAIEGTFIAPLAALAAHEQIPNRLRELAQNSLEGLQGGQWAPLHVLAHNDLWYGNVLIDYRNASGRGDSPWRERFVVIDWPGAEVRGYPLLDLMTCCRSFGLAGQQLRTEVVQHCRYLNCDLDQARDYLLVAMGRILTRLEHMPLPMFIRMADMNLQLLASVGG